MFMRNIVSYCCVILCLLAPISQPSPVSAESGIPTVMDGVVNHIIDLHQSFGEKVNGARGTNLSPTVLASLLTHETNVYEQAQLWKSSLKGNMDDMQQHIINYDSTFTNLYEDMQQHANANEKEQLVQLLQTLQLDISRMKGNIGTFISQIETLQSTATTNARDLQTDLAAIQLCMGNYRAEIDRLYDLLDAAKSPKEQDRLMDLIKEPSAKLYDKLEPLESSVKACIQNVMGVNDRVLTIGWQISLHEMQTNWTTLDVTL
ncbi:HBL/NHE enterotoxin family protein, partial [Bacillus thuringiensis]